MPNHVIYFARLWNEESKPFSIIVVKLCIFPYNKNHVTRIALFSKQEQVRNYQNSHQQKIYTPSAHTVEAVLSQSLVAHTLIYEANRLAKNIFFLCIYVLCTALAMP